MKLVACALVSLFALSAHAYENRFSVNNNPTVTWTDLRVGQFESRYDRTVLGADGFSESRRADRVRAQRVELGLTQALSESLSLTGGFMFQSKEFRTETSLGDRAVVELGSLNGSVKQAVFFDTMTLTFGADARLNVGTQQRDYLDGQHSLTPWVGAESYVGQYALGGRLFTAIYAQSTELYDYARRNASLGVMGYVDVPLFPQVNLGFAMGAARTDAQLQRAVVNTIGTEFLSEIKAAYRYDAETSINGVIESRNDTALDATSTQFSVGVTRSL